MPAMILAATLALSASVDSRWLPFMGCFRLVADQVQNPPAPDAGGTVDEPEAPRGLVCISPEGNGVLMSTYSGDDVFLEERLVADGQEHEISEGNCRGWQRIDWSQDGKRLFTRSELTCEEGRQRSVSGVSLIRGFSSWIEVQSVASGDSSAVVVRRYQPAGEVETLERLPSLTEETLREATRARAQAGAEPLEVADVVEATSRIAPPALEALLLENHSGFPLDRRALLRLADASVPPRCIDLMVALSFPDRFDVDREHGDNEGGPGFGYAAPYDPFFYSAFAYPYYFAPFGYYYWFAPYDPIYVVRPIVVPGASVGRVVSGRGYTRVYRAGSDEEGHAKRRGGSSKGEHGSSSSTSSSSGGSVSNKGYSSDSSSGRTAKPKKN